MHSNSMFKDGAWQFTKPVELEDHLMYKDGKLHRALDSDWKEYGYMDYTEYTPPLHQAK